MMQQPEPAALTAAHVGNNISKYEILEKLWCKFLVLTTFIM
jgi:hypothetical protein